MSGTVDAYEPIASAEVVAYAAGLAGYGSGATALACVESDASGNFQFGDAGVQGVLACPPGAPSTTTILNCLPGFPGRPIYLVAIGGEGIAGDPPNGAIKLIAALGACKESPSSAQINELTTVASTYALAEFMNPTAPESIGSPRSDAMGLKSAFATVANMVDVVAGTVPGPRLPVGATLPIPTMNSLADAIALAVHTAGPSDPNTQAFLCDSTPRAVFTSGTCSAPQGTIEPADTLGAILSVALNPGIIPGSAFYTLSTGYSQYSPPLSVAPGDWTIPIVYTDGIVSPALLAIDRIGNVWLVNFNLSLAKLNPGGSLISPPGGYTGGGLGSPEAMAIDQKGFVWIGSLGGAGNGDISEFDPDGNPVSPSTGYTDGGIDLPFAIAIEQGGNVWIANNGGDSLTELCGNGTHESFAPGCSASTAGQVPAGVSEPFTGGGLNFPRSIAFDASDNIWVGNYPTNSSNAYSVSKFHFDGTPILNTSSGETTGPLDVDVDGNHKIWINQGESLTRLDPDGKLAAPPSGFGTHVYLQSLRMALDGRGDVWLANITTPGLDGPGSIAELNSHGKALSPHIGFAQSYVDNPMDIAIDRSGNVWIVNSRASTPSITELVGAADPVRTPGVGPAELP